MVSRGAATHNREFLFTHESSGVVGVGADLAVNFDETLHDDLGHLRVRQGILEPVAEENDQGERLPQLVGTGARPRSKHSTQFVQHP